MKAASIGTGGFPPIDRAQWLESEQAAPGTALFGAPATAEGTAAAPRTAHGWHVLQRLDDPDPARANEQARRDIEDGADGLALVFRHAPNAFGAGLPADEQSLSTALEGIAPTRTHLRIDPHPLSRTSVDWLVAILSSKRIDPSRLSLSFGLDPAAIFAGTGRLHMSLEAMHASLPQSLAHFFAMGLPGILLEADGRVAHNAGATQAQELGVMIASAVSHLRMFEEARQPLVYAAPHIGFALSVDQDQLMSIIKFRALRRLWTRVQETCAIPPSPAVIHAESSYRMLSADNGDANVLRTAYAALGAVVAGANSLSLLPSTARSGTSGARARALALDSQLILARESHAAFVADPRPRISGLEGQVAALCEAAWEEFRRIEAEGGILASLAEGALQRRIADSRACNARAVARRGRSGAARAAMPAEPPGEAAVRCLPLLAALAEEDEAAREMVE